MDAQLTALRNLIDNPSSNPTAIAIGIVILVLALLLLIVALLAWAMPAGAPARRAATPRPQKPRKPRDPRKTLRRGGFLALAVTAVAIAAAYGTTSQSAFCGSACHDMEPHSASWRTSSHASVPCVRCHEGVPVVSALPALLSRTRSLVAQASGISGAAGSVVPSSRCLGCHREIMTGTVVSPDGVAMAHKQVIAAGETCDECHGSQGHEKVGRMPAMATCLRCHDGRRASTTCGTCHKKPADTLIRARDTRFGKVALADKPTCGGCHSQAKCDACHGLRMPHPTDFSDPRRHALLAAFDRKNTLCYRCHVQNDCSKCHMPFVDDHVPGWQQVHKTYPRNTTWCRDCHRTQDMCGLCHAPGSFALQAPGAGSSQ